MKKNMFINSIGIILITVFLSLAAYAKGNDTESPVNQMKCDSSSAAITIDGIDKEWENNRTTFLNKDTAVGCHRDAGFLYIHLLTSDPEFSMQMMNFGLTLWFDPKASREKKVGVQFPVIQLQPPPPREGGKPPMGEELKKFLDARLKDVVIEFPVAREMKQMSMAEANKLGIDAIIGVDTGKGAICYELKYPLRKSSSAVTMGLDLEGQKYMDLCVETPEINLSRPDEKNGQAQEPPDNGNDNGKLQDGHEREPRPPKESEEPRPPKPSKKPPTGRISQWIRVLL